MIYLTPASISFLTQFILSFAISVFLLDRFRVMRGRQLGLLTGFFSFSTIFIGLMFFDAAFLPHFRLLYAVYLENTVLALAVVFMIQFAYHFPRMLPNRKLESRLALIISLAYLGWEIYYMGVRYYVLLVHNTVYYRPYFASYSMALVLAIAPVVMIRQCIAAEQRPVHWLKRLWQPEDKGARGARNFVLVFGVIFLLGLTNVSLIFRLPHTIYNAAMSIGILVALWLFASNYINFIPGGVTVQAKLSVLSLTLFLAILGSIGWFIAPPYIATFAPKLKDDQTLRFVPTAEGGYAVSEVDHYFEGRLGTRLDLQVYDEKRSYPIEYEFPFFGQNYTNLYVLNSGMVSFGEPFWHPNLQSPRVDVAAIFPLVIDMDPDPASGGGVYAWVDDQTGRLVVTWDHMPALHQPQSIFTFQIILFPDGVFEINYHGLPLPFNFDPDATPSANPWIFGAVPGAGENLHADFAGRAQTEPAGQLAIIENFNLDFRNYLHEFIHPLAVIVVGGSIILMLGMPLLLQYSIVNPLSVLTHAVNRVEQGDLDINIPVVNQDEIGYLTGAFNLMAAQIQDLINNLNQRFVQLFEHLPDFIGMVSADGMILNLNPAALAFFGYDADEIIGKPLESIYLTESQEQVDQLIQKWPESGKFEEEIVIVSKSGELRTTLLSIGPVRDQEGKILYSLVILHDITERVKAESAIADLAAMEERRRLASDLHDSMTQSLHSLSLSAETAQHLHKQGDAHKLGIVLPLMEDSARQAVQEMRLLCYELQLTPETEVDWFEILSSRLESVERRVGIQSELQIENPGVIAEELRKEIFYVVIEALNNTLRHSYANQVQIAIFGTPYQITVSVRDDGCGFDPINIKKKGMGLRNMEERVRSIGGVLQIHSAPNAGTEVHVDVDLKAPPK